MKKQTFTTVERGSNGEYQLVPVQGRAISAGGLGCFIYKRDKDRLWSVTELTSGCMVATGLTQKSAIALACERVEKAGLEKTKELAACQAKRNATYNILAPVN